MKIMEVMVGEADFYRLRTVIWNESHVVRDLFKWRKSRNIVSLRPRPHDFKLPAKYDKNYIPRILYKYT